MTVNRQKQFCVHFVFLDSIEDGPIFRNTKRYTKNVFCLIFIKLGTRELALSGQSYI